MKRTPKSTGPKSKSKRTSDVLEINEKHLIDGDDELRELVEQATLHAQVASSIYEARTAAGLTQKQLAELIGTRQSVISQLEDADYEGHSLSMLRRIAAALESRVELRIVPNEPQQVAS